MPHFNFVIVVCAKCHRKKAKTKANAEPEAKEDPNAAKEKADGFGNPNSKYFPRLELAIETVLGAAVFSNIQNEQPLDIALKGGSNTESGTLRPPQRLSITTPKGRDLFNSKFSICAFAWFVKFEANT